MASFPRLLLLDEPFLGLAPVWIQQISGAILQLRQRGTTVLMTEQMARPALKLATRGYVMRGGEVRRGGTVKEIRDLALAEEYLSPFRTPRPGRRNRGRYKRIYFTKPDTWCTATDVLRCWRYPAVLIGDRPPPQLDLTDPQFAAVCLVCRATAPLALIAARPPSH
jgi:energy-coupling factor transporter ATP-binding protein EcfA2